MRKASRSESRRAKGSASVRLASRTLAAASPALEDSENALRSALGTSRTLARPSLALRVLSAPHRPRPLSRTCADVRGPPAPPGEVAEQHTGALRGLGLTCAPPLPAPALQPSLSVPRDQLRASFSSSSAQSRRRRRPTYSRASLKHRAVPRGRSFQACQGALPSLFPRVAAAAGSPSRPAPTEAHRLDRGPPDAQDGQLAVPGHGRVVPESQVRSPSAPLLARP